MSTFINHYSFLLVLSGVVVVAGLVLLTNKPKPNDIISFSAIFIAAIIVWVVLHPRQSPLMDDAKMVQDMIGKGTPVLLEFQSPYCISCTQVQPIVDSLENEINGEVSIGKKLHFIRLNIQEQAAQQLAPLYNFEVTPTFIFFDENGNEVWRTVGTFDPQLVRNSLP
ncbi:MAG: thioredoxin family protein [Anaerolineales bacterium]